MNVCVYPYDLGLLPCVTQFPPALPDVCNVTHILIPLLIPSQAWQEEEKEEEHEEEEQNEGLTLE